MIMREKVQLTKLAPNCGCAAKVGPGTWQGFLADCRSSAIRIFWWGRILPDDAAVYRVSSDLALIQTLDFYACGG